MSSVLISAARVFLLVNGVKVGRVFGFSWSSNAPKKQINGLDSHRPYELAPTTTTITGDISVYRFMGDGGIEGAGMTPTHQYIPEGQYFSLQLIDQLTNTTIFRADECSVQNQAWAIGVKGLMMGHVSFQALNWSNETG